MLGEQVCSGGETESAPSCGGKTDQGPRERQPIVFDGKIKKARGLSPAPLGNYLFLAALRRAVPVFFAVVFFAAAVLRAGFFFAVFFFATAIVHPSYRAGWLLIHSSYIRSSNHTCRI
jgi:hypothetical protein